MSSNTLFDLLQGNNQEEDRAQTEIAAPEEISEELPPKSSKEGQLEFMKMAEDYKSPQENKFIGDIKNLGKNLLKSFAVGTQKLGRAMGPTGDIMRVGKPESEVQGEFKESLEDILPSEPSGSIGKAASRFLEEAPLMVGLGPASMGQMAARTGLASTLEQITEDLGGGELAQGLAGLTAYIGPEMTTKLLEKGSSSEIVKVGKQLGLSDKEIAPLLNSEFRQKFLSKLATRRGRTESVLQKTKKALGNVYEGLRTGSDKALTGEQSTKVVNDLQDKLFKMPSKVRETISGDLSDLTSKPITADSLINFYQDVSHNLSGKTKQLANLKDPIKEGLALINPDVANKFDMTNKLYSKYYEIAGRLKPNLVSDLWGASEAVRMITGITMGNYPLIVEAVGEHAAKTMAREMLLNPRLKQLGTKFVSAINQNKIQAVKKITDSIIKEVKGKNPEVAKELQSINWDEWNKEASNPKK